METNGNLVLDGSNRDRNVINAILDSFPIKIEVHPGSDIHLEANDQGISTHQGDLWLHLRPRSPYLRFNTLGEFDQDKYEIGFSSSDLGSELTIRNSRDRYRLIVHSCRRSRK